MSDYYNQYILKTRCKNFSLTQWLKIKIYRVKLIKYLENKY